MKTIGIIDITTVGACICANEIVIYANQILPNGQHPEFVMHSFSFDRYSALIFSKDWFGLAKLINQAILKMKAAGADFIIIPSNTPHYCYEQLAEISPLPILNLIQLSVEYCQLLKIKKVAVLGTKITMQDTLYRSKLEDAEIEQITIADEETTLINDLVMNELIHSKINPNNIEKVRQCILKLDCDGIILGCTELPMVYTSINLPGKDVVDTTRLLAHAAVNHAIT